MTTTVGRLEAVFTANTSGFDAGLARVEGGMQRAAGGISGSLESVGNRMAGLGQKLAIPAAAINAFMGVSINAAMNFESAFAGVVKTVDGTDEQLANLRDTIRDMATDSTNPLAGLDNAHESIARIMELGGQLGVPLEDLEGFAQTVGSMTIATDLTADSAAMMMAQFAAITGMSFDNLDEMGSTIVALGNNMPTTESAILEFGQRLAGIGSTIGLSEAEILALGAAMSGMGINAEAGGTAMTQVFNEMISAVATGGADLEGFASVAGTSADEFAAAWEANPTTALQDFLVGLGDLDEAAQVRALEDLGLDGVRVADTLRRLSGNTEMLSDALDIANEGWEENSALNEEAQKRLATTRAQFNVFKNTLKDVAISIGNALLPAFNEMLKIMQPIAKWFSNLIQDNPGVVRAISRVGTVLGGLATFLIMAGKGMAILAAVMNPVTLAIAAFAAAWGTNFLGLRDVMEPVVQAISRSFGVISSFISGITDKLKAGDISGAIDSFFSGLGGLVGRLARIWGDIDFGAMMQSFLDGIASAWDTLVSAGAWVRDNLIVPLIGAIASAANFVSNVDWAALADNMLSRLAAAWGIIVTAGAWVKDNLIQPLIDSVSGAIGSVDLGGAVQSILSSLSNAWSTLVSAGTWVKDNLIQTLLDSAQSAVESVDWYGLGFGLVTAIGNAIKTGVDFVGFLVDSIFQPSVEKGSEAVASVGWGDIASAIFNAIKSAIGAVIDFRTWIVETIYVPFVSGMVDGAMQYDWSAVPGAIMDAIGAVFSTAIDMVQWLGANVFTPLINNAAAAVESVDWQNVGYSIMDGIGNAIGAVVDFVAWIIDSIFSPAAESGGAAAEGTDWSGVANAIITAIGDAIGAVWDVASWVFTTILGPMATGMFMKINEMDWSNIPTVLFNVLAAAVGSVWDVLTWVFDTFISPLFNAFVSGLTSVDWASIPAAIFAAISGALPDMAAWAAEKITGPVVGAVNDALKSIGGFLGMSSGGAAAGVDAGLGVEGAGTSGQVFTASQNATFGLPGNASGTHWTGSGPLNRVTGLVHAQEAVVPAGGMMVVPSPRGLMLEGSMAGGGRGSTVVIQQLDVHGVENVQELFDQLQRVAKQRA